MGLKVVGSLIKFETDAELFETLLTSLASCIQDYKAEVMQDELESPDSNLDKSNVRMPDLPSWFEKLSQIENFNLLIRFVSVDLSRNIASFLGNHLSCVSLDSMEKYRLRS